MELTHVVPTRKAPASTFTGDVFVDPIYLGQEPSRMIVTGVYFTPGARTNWHSHAVGQTLHVTEGQGLVVGRDGTVIPMTPGDTVYTPPGEEHWHGGTPGNLMCHLAMLEGTGDGDGTTWLEPVTDADYAAADQVQSSPSPVPTPPSNTQENPITDQQSDPTEETATHPLADFTPGLMDLTSDVLFGDVWKRPGLSPKERSLVTVACLITNGNTDQLVFHLGLAGRNGNTEEELKEAITHLAFYAGWPPAMAAMNVAKNVLTD